MKIINEIRILFTPNEKIMYKSLRKMMKQINNLET